MARTGLDFETLCGAIETIIFMSDNGGEVFHNITTNGNLKEGKGFSYEGGVRVPFIVKWPGKVKAGSSSNQTICLTDFFATVKNLFNAETQSTADSYTILSIAKGTETANNRAPVIHHSGGGKFAIRDGDWKMIEGLGSGGFTEPKFPKSLPGEPEGQLYNMKNDPQEKNNLYLKQSQKVEELKAKLLEIRGY